MTTKKRVRQVLASIAALLTFAFISGCAEEGGYDPNETSQRAQELNAEVEGPSVDVKVLAGPTSLGKAHQSFQIVEAEGSCFLVLDGYQELAMSPIDCPAP